MQDRQPDLQEKEADPWTLEHTAENCWLEPTRSKSHQDLRRPPLPASQAVASDMTESASPGAAGLHGMDSIMEGCDQQAPRLHAMTHLVQAARPATPTKRAGRTTTTAKTACSPPDMYGIGRGRGHGDAERGAREEAGGGRNPQQKLANQLLVDRLGMATRVCTHGATAISPRCARSHRHRRVFYKRACGSTCRATSTAMLGNAVVVRRVPRSTHHRQYPCSPPSTSGAPTSCSPMRRVMEEPR